jgi:putative peptide zinc metalloprotease protein
VVGKLHQADVLQTDVSPDATELFERYEQGHKRGLKQRYTNPLAIKIPLLDPDKLTTILLHLFRPFFGWTGFLIWLLVVVAGLVAATLHWSQLTENIFDTVLVTNNIVLLLICFPLVKALHEFGHALAVKNWGGEVHEMGVMLLVLMPVPYVDASASSVFPEKHRRIVVAAAGMMVEAFVAAIAMFVWTQLEPGMLRAMAFNTMLIAGISTVLFNGNPLLRFDGYYMFADWLEIPNLASRANQYMGYLLQRYLLGINEIASPADTPGEALWFFVYSISAFIYRLFITLFIVVFIAGKFFVVGIILAAWAGLKMFLLPILKPVKFALFSPVLNGRRGFALLLLCGVVAGLIAIGGGVHVPVRTLAESVVWIPDESTVYSESGGFVEQILVNQNQVVTRGQPLIRLSDPHLPAEIKVFEAEVAEALTRYHLYLIDDPTQAALAQEALHIA